MSPSAPAGSAEVEWLAVDVGETPMGIVAAADEPGGPGHHDLPEQLDLNLTVPTAAAVRRIEDSAEVRPLLRGLIRSCSREVLSALPAGPYRTEVFRSSWEVDLDLLRRGVRAFALYQADAVRSVEVLGYLTDFAAAGATIRVGPRVSHRMIVIDRRTVVLAVNEDTLKAPYLFIEEPAMVRQLFAHYRSLWRSAHSVGVGLEDSLAVDTVREVVHVLADGLSDTAAARRLNISERTLRRRIAVVLELMGATTRFEAGVKAAQYGWL